MPVLDAILANTRSTLPDLRKRAPALERAALAGPPPRDFQAALRRPHVALIAEVKRRSPSAGAINPDLDPNRLADEYREGGAAAISVLTDREFFGGALADLTAVSARVSIPVLRKDFLLDEVQLFEARAAGADAVLLIVRALDQQMLRQLLRASSRLGMAALVEIHTAGELDRALEAGATILGVNARDLDTLTINRDAAWQLLANVPPTHVAVAESGMTCIADVTAAAVAGADAVLIGGALASANQPRVLAQEFSSVWRHER